MTRGAAWRSATASWKRTTSSSTMARTRPTSLRRSSRPASTKACRSSRSRRVTPGRARTAGSMSRGMPMSTISSGRVARAAMIGVRSAGPSTTVGEPVELRRTSAPARAAGSWSRSTTSAPTFSATLTARWRVRLATTTVGPVAVGGLGGRGQVVGHALAHLPRAQQHQLAAREGAQTVGGQADRGLRQRRDAPADGRLRPDPLADLEGVAEQPRQPGSGRPLVAGPLPGGADLAQDLALAQHHRLQARGHAEQVGRGRLVVVGEEVVAEVLRREEGQPGEEVADVLHAAVEALGDHVDLGAVARRQDDGLAHEVAAHQVAQGLGQVLGRDGHALEDLERDRAVAQSDDDERHA